MLEKIIYLYNSKFKYQFNSFRIVDDDEWEWVWEEEKVEEPKEAGKAFFKISILFKNENNYFFNLL